MIGRSHVALGAAAGALCAMAVHPWTDPGAALLCIPVAAVMGPAPDIDHHAAPARAVLVAGLVGLALVQPYVLILYAAPLLYRIAMRIAGQPRTHLEVAWREFWRHRGGTHRISTALGAGGVVCAVCYLAGTPEVAAHGWVIGAAVSAGWLSHIYGDARTYSGISVGGWDGVRIGRPVRTGSTRTWARKHEGDPWRSEQFLYETRFVPAALLLGISAVLLVAP